MLTPKNGVAYKKSAMNGIFPLLPQWIGKKVILKPMRILHFSHRIFDVEKGSEYLMFYPRRHVKGKHFKCKFTFNNGLLMNKELNLCKV